ncbi:MAG: hypothetical protein M3R06_04395 [Chloroflexota bacterium]|nr:hypothetical protein [Chloroflexota bacterium]
MLDPASGGESRGLLGLTQTERPFAWWGPLGRPVHAHGLDDLVAGSVLPAALATILAEAVKRGASLVVVAGPSGAGKTTLLSALLERLSATTRRVHIRGCYEPFDFRREPESAAGTILLINEISAHLPVYLWGPGVRRVLQAGLAGYQLAATAHAFNAQEFVASLAGYPLRVPLAEIVAFHLVVALDAWNDGTEIHREVREVTALRATFQGLEPRTLALRPTRGAPMRIDHHGWDEVLARLD